MTTRALMPISVVLLALVAPLTACSGQSGTGSGPSGGASTPSTSSNLTVAGLMAKVTPSTDGRAASCPVEYDVGAAAGAAGISGAAAPSETYPVEARSSDGAEPSSFLKQAAPAVSVGCAYRVGSTEFKTYLFATGTSKAAVSGALPTVVAWSGSSVDELGAWVTAANTVEPGAVMVTPNGKVAIARLHVTDGGGALVVATDPAGGLPAPQLSKLAEGLATHAG